MVAILVVTPSKGFGELIQQVLEEAGNYAVVTAASGGEAVQLVKTEQPTLCILDADLKDVPLPQLGDTLRELLPSLLLVLIPPDDDPDEELPEMEADGYLSKPFYLPDLVSTVEDVLQGRKHEKPAVPGGEAGSTDGEPEEQAEQSDKSPAPVWLKDVDVAARHLTRLTLESASQAALITRGADIWAYAGGLDRDAAEELASTVAHYWADDGGADLARYVRLDATGGDYMLYATDLGGNFVLALAFDAEMPFSKIRSQASRLARDLAVTTLETTVDAMVAETQEQETQTAGDTQAQLAEIMLDPPVDTGEDSDMLPALDPFAPLEDEDELGGDEPQAWEKLLSEPQSETESAEIKKDREETTADEVQELPLASEELTAEDLPELFFASEESATDELREKLAANETPEMLFASKELTAEELQELPLASEELTAEDMPGMSLASEEVATEEGQEMSQAGGGLTADELEGLPLASEELTAADLPEEPLAGEEMLAEDMPAMSFVSRDLVADELPKMSPADKELTAEELQELPFASEELTAEDLQDMPFLEVDRDTDLQPVPDPAGAYFEELARTAETEELIEPLFDDVPPPIPEDWLPEEQPSEERKGFLEELISDSPPANEPEEAKVLELEFDSEAPDAELVTALDETFADEEQAAEVFSSEETLPREVPSSLEEAPLLEYDAEVTQVSARATSDIDTLPHEFEPMFPGGMDATIPAGSFGESRKQLHDFEGESPALVSLTYSCVLLPRLTEHHLTGELAANLSDLTTQLCVAFGWRLEQLSIRPDYLYWMVNVPPNTSPGYLMRIMRQHTSQRLFADFPTLEASNPSGDFWAPGYLILSGDDIPPHSLINDFIRQTRERQGLIGSR